MKKQPTKDRKKTIKKVVVKKAKITDLEDRRDADVKAGSEPWMCSPKGQ